MIERISAVGGSNLDKAVNYSLNNRKELEAFLLDGRLELTNNRTERSVKPFVMGKKTGRNLIHIRASELGMMWYSMLESAKLNGLDVYVYLVLLLTELPKLGIEPSDDQLDKLMLWSQLPDYCK